MSLPVESTKPERQRPLIGGKPGSSIYTGWKVVGANSVLWALQSLVWVQGYGNLAVELRARFGWSKTLFSVVFAATRAEAALMGPMQGRVIERIGIKAIMRLGAVITFVSFIALSQVSSKASFLVVMMVAAIGVTLMGFLTLSTSTVSWFERKRARALSLQTMGFAVGGFAAPLLVGGYNWFGWRWTTAGAGTVLAAVAWWASSLSGTTRDDVDEPMDGIAADDEEAAAPKAEGVTDRHFTASEALRTKAFWMISFGHGTALVVVSASMAHLALYLTEDRGFSAGRAALVAGLVPVFQLIGTLSGGFLGDRVNKRLIAGCAMGVHGLAMFLLTWVDHWGAIGAFVVLHGLAWGVRGPQMQAIRADYFGATDFARIMGWSGIIVTTGAMLGPLLAGSLADSTGDYQLGFTIVSIIAASGAIWWVLASPPPAPTRWYDSPK